MTPKKSLKVLKNVTQTSKTAQAPLKSKGK